MGRAACISFWSRMSRLAPDDVRLWRRAMQGVAPLPGRTPPPEVASERPPPARRPAKAVETPAPRPPPAQPAPPLDRFAGIDRATAERVKRGRYPVEATLDL